MIMGLEENTSNNQIFYFRKEDKLQLTMKKT